VLISAFMTGYSLLASVSLAELVMNAQLLAQESLVVERSSLR